MNNSIQLKRNDRALKKVEQAILDVAKSYRLKILSIVLYGSRARGDYSFDSDYDLFVLFSDETSLLEYTQFVSELRLRLHRVKKAKLYSNTLSNFIHIMNSNPFLGCFCFIIATEGVPIYDPEGIFERLHKDTVNLSFSNRIGYIKNCVTMSEVLGSPRWVHYWKNKLENLK